MATSLSNEGFGYMTLCLVRVKCTGMDHSEWCGVAINRMMPLSPLGG